MERFIGMRLSGIFQKAGYLPSSQAARLFYDARWRFCAFQPGMEGTFRDAGASDLENLRSNAVLPCRMERFIGMRLPGIFQRTRLFAIFACGKPILQRRMALSRIPAWHGRNNSGTPGHPFLRSPRLNAVLPRGMAAFYRDAPVRDIPESRLLAIFASGKPNPSAPDGAFPPRRKRRQRCPRPGQYPRR